MIDGRHARCRRRRSTSAAPLCTADERACSASRSIPRSPRTASSISTTRAIEARQRASTASRASRCPATTIAAARRELVLIDNIPSPRGNHNAGDLQFGNDGYLYVSVGDGGCDYAGDSGCAGQNDASRDQHVLLGKILRITSDRRHPARQPVPGRRHGPLQRHAAARRRATSARRPSPGGCATRSASPSTRTPPARASSSTTSARTPGRRSTSAQAGADYGWNVREGPCANGSTTNCGPPPAGMTNPIYDYSHGEPAAPRSPAARSCRTASGRRPTTAPTCSATTSAARSSCSTPAAAAASRAASSRPTSARVVNMTFGPSRAGGAGALLHELRERRRGAPHRVHRRTPTGRRPRS